MEKLDKKGEKEYNIIKEEIAKPKTPAEIYGIDKQFTEQFNSMSSDMQGLFAPYLKEGAVDTVFDDSGLSAEEKANKNYKSPLDMALKMQTLIEIGFNYKTLNSGQIKTKSINPYSVLTHDLLFGKLKYPSYNNSFTSFSSGNGFMRTVKIEDYINIEDIISFHSRETWRGQHHPVEQEYIIIGLGDYK